jgi:hypothetical protein
VWWCEEGKLFKVTIFILEEIINPLLEKYYNLVYNSPINIKKGAFTMEAVLTKESEEIRKGREELFRELDKGIRDMEEGSAPATYTSFADLAATLAQYFGIAYSGAGNSFAEEVFV